MFDITKATPQERAVYAQLTAQERTNVDKGYASIREYANALSTPAADKPAGASVPLPPTHDAAKQDDLSYGSLLDQGIRGTVQHATGEAIRYGADEVPSDALNILGSDAVRYAANPISALVDAMSGKKPVGSIQLPSIPLVGEAVGKPLMEAGQKKLDLVEQQRKQQGIEHGWDGGIKGMGIDAVQNPDSLAGLAGGLLAKTGVGAAVGEGLIAIPTSRVYLDKYYALRDAGVPRAEAKARAAADAAIEFGTENISFGVAGKVSGKIVTGTAAKIATSFGTEAVEEAIAEIGQDGVDNLISKFQLGSKSLQDAADKNKFQSLGDAASRISYSAALGGLMGGAMRTVTAPGETHSEIKDFTQRTADMLERGRKASALQDEMGRKTPEEAIAMVEGHADFPPKAPTEVLDPEAKKKQEDLAYAQNEERQQKIRDTGHQQGEAEALAPTNPIAAGLANAGLDKQGVPPTSDTLTHPDKALYDEAQAARQVGAALNLKEQEALAAKQKVALTAARKTHATARTAEQVRLGKDLANNKITDDDYVSGMKKWNKENPLPTPEVVAAKLDAAPVPKTKTPKKTGKKAQAKANVEAATSPRLKSEPETETEETTTVTPEALTESIKNIQNKQTADSTIASNIPRSTPVKAVGRKIVNAGKSMLKTLQNQTKDMQPREMNALHEGVKSGRIRVVGSEHVVGGKPMGNASGLYHQGIMYVNQDHLDTGTRIMDVINHEVDHYYKYATDIKGSDVKSVLGGKVNVKDTVAKIEKLAANKNVVGVKAKNSAHKAVENENARRASAKIREAPLTKEEATDLYQDEIVAYFHQHATAASRGGTIASARSALADLHSQLKDGALSKVFGKLDEVKDSGYVSRKRVENLKHTTPEEIAGMKPLQTFAGSKAKGFDQAQNYHHSTFLGTDGMERFFVDDSQATVNMKAWRSMPLNGTTTLEALWDHHKLYEQYPYLANLVVHKYNKQDGSGGYLQPSNNPNTLPSIYVNEYYDEHDRDTLNLTLLHETQHAIQDHENFARGSNESDAETTLKNEAFHEVVKQLSDPKVVGEVADFVAKRLGFTDFDAMTEEVHNDDANDGAKQLWNKLLEIYRPETLKSRRGVVARHLINNGLLNDKIESKIGNALFYYSNISPAKARQRYMDHSGEREARLVEQMYYESKKLDEIEARTGRAFDRDVHASMRYQQDVQGKGEYLRATERPKKSARLESFREKGEGEWVTGTKELFIKAFQSSLNNMTGLDVLATPVHTWAKKAVPAYLNKYAGTPEDPLNDMILVPEIGLTWEQLLDRSVLTYTKNGTIDPISDNPSRSTYTQNPGVYHRAKEKLDIPKDVDKNLYYAEATSRLRDFLEHVGDYMTLEVPETKLQQYDFVRAVKETAAWDKANLAKADKLAKQKMDKANEGLPVHTEYEDGSKWVQLTKPGSFAHESDVMGHSVRGYEPTKTINRFGEKTLPNGNISVGTHAEPNPDWIEASGDSGHERYGHGGWESIKSGKAKVYSLRDKDGRSHVTIEVDTGGYTEADDKTFVPGKYSSITQIKGKGNAKPVAKYIPFVQDFIRSGNYLEVGDNRNAEMFETNSGPRTQAELDAHEKAMTMDDPRLGYLAAKDSNIPILPIEGLPAKKSPRLESRSDEEPSETRKLIDSVLELPGVRTILGTMSTAWRGGRVLREIREAADGIPAEYSLVAEANFNDLTKALAEASEENPQFDWTQFWNKIENEKDGEQRDRIVNAMAREFPEVARSYRMFRDTIDNMTDLIVMERAKRVDAEPFDDSTEEGRKEINLYNALLANKGRYTTRSYLLSKGQTGDLFGKLSWRAYKNATKAVEKGENINEADVVAATRVANAFAFYQRNLAIPEQLPENLSNLRDLYSAWYPANEGTSKKEMVAALEARRGLLTQEEINNNAEEIIQELLGLTPERAGFLASRIRGLQRDNTIMLAKQDVPKVIRELMGEVTNMPLKLMLTLTAQAHYIARTSLMADVAKLEGVSILAADRHKTGNKKYSRLLNGKEWGAMDGRYVTPTVEGMLIDQKTIPAKFMEAAKLISLEKMQGAAAMLGVAGTKWGQVSAIAKGMKILGNPLGYVYNVGGNFFNLVRTGNLNPKYMRDATSVAYQMIGSKGLRTVDDMTRKMNRMGVLDSAQIGELKVEALDILRDEVYKQTDADNKGYKARRVVRRAVGTTREVYAMTDVVSKIANTLYLLDQRREFHELNGDNFTEEQVEREVADIIKDENVTFGRSAPILRAIESKGFTWFLTYIGETFRTQAWNAVHIVSELKEAKNANTPEARVKMLEIAGRHALGSIASITLVTTLLQALASMGDDDKDEGWKRMLPAWARIGAPLIMGYNKDGKPLVLTLSRFDQVGPTLDILRAVQNGTVNDVEDVKNVFLDMYIAPTIGKAAWDRATATNQKDASAATKRIVESFVPALVVNSYKYDYPQGDDAMSQVGKIVRLIGGRLETADPNKAIKGSAYEFNDIQTNGRKDLYDSLSNANSDQFINRLETYRAKEAKAFKDLVELDQALHKMGKTSRQRRTMLTDGGLSVSTAEMVVRGQNMDAKHSQLLSKKSIDAFLKNAKHASTVQGKELELNVKAMKAQLSKLGYKFKE